MKKLLTLWFKLTDKNFDAKLKSAKATTKMIVASTNGSISHFYDTNGVKIRGYSNTSVKTRSVFHPLITKYQ
jgi:hypothetical protein